MQTVSIDIINKKAFDLLKDLEQLKLIRFRSANPNKNKKDWLAYKGTMAKQSLNEIEQQLKELRTEWD